MQTKKLIGFAVIGTTLLLAGCQTTRNYSFSEWQEQPIGKSRFNVPTISNIPVTKLEQNDRNNGQVQNEKWELGCGNGIVTSSYTFDVWFTQQTEQKLKDEEEFRAEFAKNNIEILKTYPVTSNDNGRAVGYYADANIGNISECKVAKFGFRATRGQKIYDNDHGGIDAVVSVYYCGQPDLNMTKLIQGISLVKDRDAYDAQVAALPKQQCPARKTAASQSSSFEDSDWATVKKGDYKRTFAMTWGDGFSDGYLDTQISLKDYGGSMEFVGRNSGNCKMQLSVSKYDSPAEGSWFTNCVKGDFASGTFTLDRKRNLTGEGMDQDGKAVAFTLWLPNIDS
ncbi:hypothetical protein [Thalassospira povalilytica]|uniref:Lipoprotein n=1 Tax=Thalassospira povalilytica TaxID=732237 RepID=A0A8I1M6U8_9PROT|nr:hypothetical protein [Thalassospira povalilytica]MBN8196277.1 hypothetical protein [Thalassospira povalilytica]